MFGGVHHYGGKDRSLMGEKVQQRKLTMLPPIGKKKKEVTSLIKDNTKEEKRTEKNTDSKINRR